jgi:protoporphyrinogen oxidase
MTKPHVVVLGGGPAGVGAAYRLRDLDRAKVTLIERGASFGGNAGSFYEAGQHLDYGSHRLHSACHEDILTDIRRLLGGDLANRPRNGRIRLRGKWVKFPLQAKDLFLSLDRRFALGAAADMARGALPGSKDPGDSFASVLQANLGPTICEHFYFPYARKMWGREPEVLSDIQAYKRVSS